MTRWARGGTANKKKPLSSTPWSELSTHLPGANAKSLHSKAPEITHVKLPENALGKKRTKSIKKEKVLEHKTVKCKKRKSMESEKVVNEFGTTQRNFSNERPSKQAKLAEGDEKKVSKQECDRSYFVDCNIEKLDKTREDIATHVKKDKRREHRRLKRIQERTIQKRCFNCQKPGHDMSDCPSVRKDVSQGTGICFKCGSTEHNVDSCRAKLPPGEYPYAKCFICGEMGHLSRQCPDNPRGLYPKGGCCRLCGSVEHYRKDCPELQKQHGIQDVMLTTMSDGKFSVDDEISLYKPKKHVVKQKRCKIVTF